ncbi:MAG: SDR family oxidoreductase [Bacillota bacterium]|nr:SDR family oxidoreductase [Bacillota bacterium]
MDNPYGRTVLITGASSGIGRATALALCEKGFRVYGTSRSERREMEKKCGEGSIKMLKMDVLDEKSIKAAVDHVVSREGSIDILINNAGWGVAGSVEDISAEEARRQMDVNFMGAALVIKHILPIMREKRKGLIINVSSVGGYIWLPFQAYYSASKSALEALSEALHIELKPFNIRVSIVEPTDTKTGFTEARAVAKAALENDAYKEEFARSLKKMAQFEQNGQEPAEVAKQIIAIIKKKKPPIRRPVGLDSKLLLVMKRLLPSRWVIAAVGRFYMPGPPEKKTGSKPA